MKTSQTGSILPALLVLVACMALISLGSYLAKTLEQLADTPRHKNLEAMIEQNDVAS